MAADSLAAVDAPPVSHMLNLAAAADAGVDADQIRGVLAAITPIIGTPRVAEPALTQAKGRIEALSGSCAETSGS
jgi:hypothetical protein